MTDVGGAIAWIGDPAAEGRWGSPGGLAIPLDDRGLLLADGLFETVLVEEGEPRLLEAHIQRWQRSAALLGMASPPALEPVRRLAREAVARSGIGAGALRLNWSRGGGGRGLDLPAPHGASRGGGPGRFWLQLAPTLPRFDPLAVIVSPSERRCASSLLSRCKTFAYGPSIQARRQARAAGADDALLESSAGGLCCGTAANLLVRHRGRWLTPALGSGCLPGVMRGQALERGLVEQAAGAIGLAAVEAAAVTEALLINSLGCRPLASIAGHRLPVCDPEGSRRLWRLLVDGAAGPLRDNPAPRSGR